MPLVRPARYLALPAVWAVLSAAAAAAQDPTLAERLVGDWTFVKTCRDDLAPTGGSSCFQAVVPRGGVRDQLHFGVDGTATVITSSVTYGLSGPSGIYVIDTRETGGETEYMLSIAGQELGLVELAGDTLVLRRRSAADRPQFVGDSLTLVSRRSEQYFVRTEDPER